MKQLRHPFVLLAGIAFLGLSSHASASPVGTVSITNCTPDGGISITATTITWLPNAGTNLGCIATGLPTSVSYSGGTFTSGTGTISDLPGGSINPFMALAGGSLDFSLLSFQAPAPTDGVCSTTVALTSGSCVVFAGSPFLLTPNGSGTGISLVAEGVATDTGNASTSPYVGLFTTQFGLTTAQIATVIDTAGGTIESTYSATLTLGPGTGTQVPEPSTVALLSVGLVLFGIGRKRFGKR